jgi:hypothetical protein
MPDFQSDWEYLEAIRRERGVLLQQIKDSQATIARSQELIRRLDELLAKAEPKP